MYIQVKECTRNKLSTNPKQSELDESEMSISHRSFIELDTHTTQFVVKYVRHLHEQKKKIKQNRKEKKEKNILYVKRRKKKNIKKYQIRPCPYTLISKMFLLSAKTFNTAKNFRVSNYPNV